ncbi:Host cell attachment-required protein [Chlamydiales bacterium STE3]|nr:Host cell attachment-required protein [Chlamydiales bacterium STE3]
MEREAWVVVADNAYARIFRLEKNRHLVEVETLVHPASRLREQDLVSDRPGRSFESSTVARRSVGTTNPPKKQEAINFSKIVANYLNEATNCNRCEKIYLAASPSFLGLLRQSLNKTTTQIIENEINKEITHLDPKEICAFFPFAHP